MKKVITLAIFIYLLACGVVSADMSFPEERKVLLYERQTSEILFSQNEDQKIYPASTTKIMTALLALEHFNLEDEITIGTEVDYITNDSSTANLKVGERVTAKDLLYGLMLPSGNDAAYSIAAAVGETITREADIDLNIAAFVDMMNEKAISLGANNSNFTNPHGLHQENHYTTLEDMLKITESFLKYDISQKIVNSLSYNLETNLSTHNWYNTNILLHKKWNTVPYVSTIGKNQYYTGEFSGVKTGNTKMAGRCLVFTANSNNMELVGMVFNSDFDDIWGESVDLVDYADDNYQVHLYGEVDKAWNNLYIDNSKNRESLSIVFPEDIYVLHSKGNEEIEVKVEYNENILERIGDNTFSIKRDIQANEAVATLTIDTISGEMIVPLLAGFNTDKKVVFDYIYEYRIVLMYIIAIIFLLILIIKKFKMQKEHT